MKLRPNGRKISNSSKPTFVSKQYQSALSSIVPRRFISTNEGSTTLWFYAVADSYVQISRKWNG
ncbi:MAG: hypothetical protein WBD31_06585, partial [Rubripirellula sp.]